MYIVQHNTKNVFSTDVQCDIGFSTMACHNFSGEKLWSVIIYSNFQYMSANMWLRSSNDGDQTEDA